MGSLHAAGIGIGVIERWPVGSTVLRGIGTIISAVGVYLLVGLVT